ncbi:MAG: hypothetical protein WCC87_10950, partial [Candidatus Korobacteraceae bacterium]
MRVRTALLALILTFSSAAAMGQKPSGSSAGQSATSPGPQAVPDNTSNAGNDTIATPQTNSALQARIENAIRNEPTLGSSHIAINVTDSGIDLS